MANCLYCHVVLDKGAAYRQFCTHKHLKAYMLTESDTDILRDQHTVNMMSKDVELKESRKELLKAYKEIDRLNAIINRLL